MSAVDDLLAILDLEQLEVNLFRGRSPQSRWQRVCFNGLATFATGGPGVMVLVGAGLSACSAAQGPIRVTSGLAQTFNGRAAQGRKGCPQCLPGLARAMPALTARGAWYARTKRTRPSSETSPCRKHARPAEHARRDRLGRRQLQVPSDVRSNARTRGRASGDIGRTSSSGRESG